MQVYLNAGSRKVSVSFLEGHDAYFKTSLDWFEVDSIFRNLTSLNWFDLLFLKSLKRNPWKFKIDAFLNRSKLNHSNNLFLGVLKEDHGPPQ